MNQKELLLLGESALKKNNIEEAHFKAKRLLEFVLNQNNQQLLVHSLDDVTTKEQEVFKQKLQEIIEGKPIQYITKSQEFMGLTFYVDENVLIPQPDTEILVETTINMIKQNNKQKPLILDLCTGSGAIAISLAKCISNAQITASDISNRAIEIARKNANNNQVTIQYVCSDLFKNIPNLQFDYIVSNPPYIETNEILNLPQEVKNEPLLALDGGKDGLHFYRNILNQAITYLKPQGYLLFEIGYNQADAIINFLKSQKDRWRLITQKPIQDLSKNDRVLIFQKRL